MKSRSTTDILRRRLGMISKAKRTCTNPKDLAEFREIERKTKERLSQFAKWNHLKAEYKNRRQRKKLQY